LRDPVFSRFGTVPACDRRTDGHTTTEYTALAYRIVITGGKPLIIGVTTICRIVIFNVCQVEKLGLML